MEPKLPAKILSKSGPTDLTTFTRGKVLALYFAGFWCGPCRAFTPRLAKFYNEVNKIEQQLQILFISGDESASDFDEFYKDMPWLTIPYEDETREDLGEGYKVSSVPCLILIDKDGKIKKDKAHVDLKNSNPKTSEEIFESWKSLY